MRGPLHAEEGRNLRTGLFACPVSVLFYVPRILFKIKVFNLNYNGWERPYDKITFPES